MDFSQVLQQSQENLDSLLLKEDSLVDNYIGICDDEIRRLKYITSGGASSSMFDESSKAKTQLERWQLEKNSWSLIKRLLSIRVVPNEELPEYSSIEGSDRLLVSTYLQSDSEISEYNAVKEWLETINEPLEMLEPRATYRPFTMNNANSDRYASDYDPDAPLTSGKPLHPDDVTYLESFHRNLFGYIRRGQLSKAIQLCKTSGESWRAASLLGSLYYHDPNVGISEGDETKPPSGNKNRGAWMFVCFTIANEQTLSNYERAVYASLCGNTANILPVCETWEDAMWSFFHSVVLAKSEVFLRQFPRIRAQEFKDFISPGIEGLSIKNIFSAVESVKNERIQRQHQNVYRQLQMALIANETKEFFENLCNQIIQGSIFEADLLRFLVHMILLLRSCGVEGNQEAENEIISCFIRHLIQSNLSDAVLIYCSKLDYDLQLKLMSSLLLSIESDHMKRHQITSKAYVFGMDVSFIMKNTVRMIMEESLRPSVASEPSLGVGNSMLVNESENAMISAVEWLLHEQDQHLEALAQSNALYRRFLISGNLTALIKLNQKMEYTPASSQKFLDHIRQSKKYENLLREMRHYHSLASLLMKLKKWQGLFDSQPDMGSQGRLFNVDSDLNKWKGEIKTLSNDIDQWFMEKIVGDRWLYDSPMFLVEMPPGFDKGERECELLICRNVYYPWLFQTMFDFYLQTRIVLPQYIANNEVIDRFRFLKKGIDLVNVVVDENYGILENYDIISSLPPTDPRSRSRLQELLSKFLDGFKVYYSQNYLQ